MQKILACKDTDPLLTLMRQPLTSVSFPHIIFSSLAVGLIRYPALVLMMSVDAAFLFCL